MNAHSVSKNRNFENRKVHTIFTPPPLCNWLKETLEPELDRRVVTLFDPCVGAANLLDPFEDKYTKIGCDVEDFSPNVDSFIQEDFLTWKIGNYDSIDLILMNPPYNHTAETSKKWGRSSLFPEMFIDHCFKLFGSNVKMVCFVPMGVRLNNRCQTEKQGTRYNKIRDKWGDITSIVSLPLDVFPNNDFDIELPVRRRNVKKKIMKSNIWRKETHQEILFFNMPSLKPHYSVPESVLEELRDMDRELWGQNDS